MRLWYHDDTLYWEGDSPIVLRWKMYAKCSSIPGAPSRLAFWPWAYIFLKRDLIQHKIQCQDECMSAFDTLSLANLDWNLRDYQQEALSAWTQQQGRGLVILPTGAGKTRLSLAILNLLKVKTLICVPTIDLLKQWKEEAESWFRQKIGVLGGGVYDIQPITIATYQSALRKKMAQYPFGLHIYDEVHHLASPLYSLIAQQSYAPYRLGVSATLDEERQTFLKPICGPVCYEKRIDELSGQSLAKFEHQLCFVGLSDLEQKIYRYHRGKYLNLMARVPKGLPWNQLIQWASRIPGGKEALVSHRLQRKIAFFAEEKINWVRDIIKKHFDQKILIFTNENESAYFLGEQLSLPVLSYKTPKKERQHVLEAFRNGIFKVLVASRVLNEGIDVPDAEIAVIFSGNASERELIQRLGRVLRPRPGKSAILYELVSERTSETSVSYRRSQGLLSS